MQKMWLAAFAALTLSVPVIMVVFLARTPNKLAVEDPRATATPSVPEKVSATTQPLAAANTQKGQTMTASYGQPAFPAAEVTELKVEDLEAGTGVMAQAGQQATVNYTGWLVDGTKFDSSIGRGPFTFGLGAGQVIAGWDQGVVGMKVGGKRRLIIPPSMAYGPNGVPGAIPGNATLVFDVELIDVK